MNSTDKYLGQRWRDARKESNKRSFLEYIKKYGAYLAVILAALLLIVAVTQLLPAPGLVPVSKGDVNQIYFISHPDHSGEFRVPDETAADSIVKAINALDLKEAPPGSHGEQYTFRLDPLGLTVFVRGDSIEFLDTYSKDSNRESYNGDTSALRSLLKEISP